MKDKCTYSSESLNSLAGVLSNQLSAGSLLGHPEVKCNVWTDMMQLHNVNTVRNSGLTLKKGGMLLQPGSVCSSHNLYKKDYICSVII